MFKFIPKNEDINLIYISLINNQIKQAIFSHDNYKKDKSKKVSYLGSNINSVVYSFNQLYNFCIQYNIEVFYYEPKKHLFYKKNQNNFETSELNLSNENQKQLNYTFDFTYLIAGFKHKFKKEDNKNIKEKYQQFLKKKRRDPLFSYVVDEFDFGILFEFANDYFNNVEIEHYIDLSKIHPDIDYHNLSKNQAIISLILKENKYEISSLIYNNYLIVCEGDNLKFMGKAFLNRNNDFLVAIHFDSICEPLKNLLKGKK